MNLSKLTKVVVLATLVVGMTWAGTTLVVSPVEADAGTVATLATDVVAPENVESASAMSVMVAGNTVGATITVSPTSLVRGGLRGMRRRAGRLIVGAQGVAALNAMPGGWWFRHSCFIP